VLAVLVPDQPWPLEEALTDRSEHLRGQVVESAAHAGIRAEFLAVRGDPVAELTRVATDLRADVVVVGASARAAHRLAGSVGSTAGPQRPVAGGRRPLRPGGQPQREDANRAMSAIVESYTSPMAFLRMLSAPCVSPRLTRPVDGTPAACSLR
jgi:hypothetical protein